MATVSVVPPLAADPTAGVALDPVDAPRPDDAGEFYDDPDADYSDDGSRTLKLSPGEITPDALTPITPIEESGLLGDWGDSLDEAED